MLTISFFLSCMVGARVFGLLSFYFIIIIILKCICTAEYFASLSAIGEKFLAVSCLKLELASWLSGLLTHLTLLLRKKSCFRGSDLPPSPLCLCPALFSPPRPEPSSLHGPPADPSSRCCVVTERPSPREPPLCWCVCVFSGCWCKHSASQLRRLGASTSGFHFADAFANKSIQFDMCLI